MSLVVQAKLLRFLEQREFQRLGGAKTLKADVRIVAGTNSDLKRASAQGDFREASTTAAPSSRSARRPFAGVPTTSCRSPRASWPISVARSGAQRRASRRSRASGSSATTGPGTSGSSATSSSACPKGDVDLGAIERATIERVLEETRFNKSRAAKRLGITRGQLYIRLKKYGLDAGDEDAAGAE